MATRGWEQATPANVHNRRLPKPPSKYRNVKTVVDGLAFDSKREAACYQDLRARQAAGELTELRCQVPFSLYAPVIGGGAWAEVAVYVADFTYLAGGVVHVTDAKGAKTALYRLKRKWLWLQAGIEIQEV